MTNANHNHDRFTAYLDGALSDEETAAFEAELIDDPALEAEFDAFSESMLGLGQLRDASAVNLSIDLTEGVKSRIRRRSRGRYFSRHSEQRQRTQIHLFVLSAIALLLGAAVFATPNVLSALFGEPAFVLMDPDTTPDRGEQPPDTQSPEAAPDSDAPNSVPTEGSTPPADPLEQPEARQDGFTPPPTPSAEATARQGVSDMPERAMIQREYAYTLISELDAEPLGARLREQFGRTRVRAQDDGSILVSVDRGAVQETLLRISDLGVLHRELVDMAPSRGPVDIRFRTAP